MKKCIFYLLSVFGLSSLLYYGSKFYVDGGLEYNHMTLLGLFIITSICYIANIIIVYTLMTKQENFEKKLEGLEINDEMVFELLDESREVSANNREILFEIVDIVKSMKEGVK